MINALRVTAIAALCISAAPIAKAQEGDGAYGRFDHALVFSTSAGMSWTPGGTFAFDAGVRARILDSAGPVLSIRAGQGERLIVAGFEIRPLFPALFLLDASTGNEWVDTFVQSIGVELGAAFLPGGVSLAYGFSVEFPLIYSRDGAFDGLAIRLMGRRIGASPDYRGGPNDAGGEWNLVVGLAIDLGVRFAAGHAAPPGYRPR